MENPRHLLATEMGVEHKWGLLPPRGAEKELTKQPHLSVYEGEVCHLPTTDRLSLVDYDNFSLRFSSIQFQYLSK